MPKASNSCSTIAEDFLSTSAIASTVDSPNNDTHLSTALETQMYFSDQAIDLARQLKEAGLPWEPAPGQYVYDPDCLIEVGSPFQERVYFILDLKHFLRRSGTTEALQESLVFLPDWMQCKNLLAEYGLSSTELADKLHQSKAISEDNELEACYRLLLERLRS